MIRRHILAGLTGVAVAALAAGCMTETKPEVKPAPQAPAATKDKQAEYKLTVLADNPKAIYMPGDKIVFDVRLTNGTGPVKDQSMVWTIHGDGIPNKSGRISSAAMPVTVETSLDKPGFVLCTVTAKMPDGKTVNGTGGAGVSPLDIKAGEPVPEDFDAFWAKAKAELAKIPLKATLTPVPVKDKNLADKVECFDVKVDGIGGVPVSGYLARPIGAKKGSLPIIISYHGAGVASAGMPLGRAAKGFLALDVNAHGVINGQPAAFYKELADGSLKDYRTRDAKDPEKIYFRGMFLRVFRSLEFMKSLPEWDGRTLVVNGTSQGGGQALVAAGLDPQVTCCVAYVPALCYHKGIIYGQESGWPRFIKMKDGKPVDPAVVKTVPYYDAAAFASRIKTAECFLSAGMIDQTCSPTSVYVAFNQIPSSHKHILPTPTANHGVPKETYAAGDKFIDEHVKKQAAAAAVK